jgi:hypothetical protein
MSNNMRLFCSVGNDALRVLVYIQKPKKMRGTMAQVSQFIVTGYEGQFLSLSQTSVLHWCCAGYDGRKEARFGEGALAPTRVIQGPRRGWSRTQLSSFTNNVDLILH